MKDKLHSKVKAKNRNDELEVYNNMEIKRDIKNQMNYARVQELYSSFYGGLDPYRRNEYADGGMVKEDRNAMANLSNQFIHREYPRTGFGSNPFIDDSEKE